MKLNESVITPTNSSPSLSSGGKQQGSQTIPKLFRRSSVTVPKQKKNIYTMNQRRQNLSAINNDYLTQHSSLSFSEPILIDTMNSFFQATKIMDEEIMLPTRLKDIPVEELVLDNTVQPDSWHEIFTFVRDVRNQLQCSQPFMDDDNDNTTIPATTPTANNNNNNDLEKQEGKYSNDDEGIIVSSHDNNPYSSSSSTVSSEESEAVSTTSTTSSFDTIKDELKYHYYGLFRSLNNLTLLSNRVTEKYREVSNL